MAERSVSKRPRVAALYARTSKDRDDTYQIASQLIPMRDYAERNGMVVAHEFREEFTGTKLDRPELNKLRALVHERKIDAIIIYRADRLARMQHIAGYLLHEEFFPNDIELHVVTFGGMIRPHTRDVLVFNIESAIGQDERDSIIEKTQRGKQTKLTGGDGLPPAWIGSGHVDKYGYRRTGRGRKTDYEIVPEEGEVVRRIFDLFTNQQKGVAEILRLLNAEGVTPPAKAKGNKHMSRSYWSTSFVYKMLREPAYTGIWYANRKRYTNGRWNPRPYEECVRLEFPHLRIIDDDTFKRTQQLLDIGRSLHAPDPVNEYLMARRARCVCGYSISANTNTRKSGKKDSYYYCSNRQRHKATPCSFPYFTKARFEGLVWDCVEQLLRNPEAQLAGLKQVQEEQLRGHADTIEHLRRAKETIQECERLLSVYSDQEAEGLISRQMLRSKKTELDKRMEAAQKVHEEYAALLETKILTDEDIESLSKMLRQLNSRLNASDQPLTFKEKRGVIDALNITGRVAIENIDGAQYWVLNLFLHTEYLAKVVLEESSTCLH
jgi:DNA invertase Pin-like site-specific DNA recombinase/uncharacterized protein (UPF0335 family)